MQKERKERLVPFECLKEDDQEATIGFLEVHDLEGELRCKQKIKEDGKRSK